jgi:hypothetical protein
MGRTKAAVAKQSRDSDEAVDGGTSAAALDPGREAIRGDTTLAAAPDKRSTMNNIKPLESASAKTVTVTVPIAFRRLSGRKLILAPDGTEITPRNHATIDNALIKALARARLWQRMLDEGRYATIGELAKGEKVAVAYLSRVLRLNLLAPDITEAILDGTQPRTLQLEQLLKAWPLEWQEQRKAWGLGKTLHLQSVPRQHRWHRFKVVI